MSRTANWQSILIVLTCSVVARTQAAERFPFVIPGDDATPSATDFSGLSPQPAGADGFVHVVDGHFATDSGRLRVWGVNLCFGANFPTHDDADRVAAHLAKLGINGVRFHHHETSFSPSGLFLPDGTWDPAQVDRLDYFLARLHQHGIYANLNLHVGRTVSQRLGWAPLGTQHQISGDKHALHFQPEIQAAFWQFCRDYLGHVNPYRNLRRADDPGIAMIEIANENSFVNYGPSVVLQAPEPYRSALTRKWNAWLQQKYTTTQALRAEWTPEHSSDPKLLASSQDWTQAKLGGWQVTDNGGRSPIRLVRQNDGLLLRLEPAVRAEQAYHQQLSSPLLSVLQGETYILRFQFRADRAREVGLNVATTQGGQWEALGLSTSIEATAQWKPFEFRFTCPRSLNNAARVTFDLGGDETAVEVQELEFSQAGGGVVLPEGQTVEAGNIDLPGPDWTRRAQAAVGEFMFDTERDFYRRTVDLLKHDLGVRVPITTTQANYQPLAIVAEVADYSDMHAYWHHPIFPGRQWDSGNWTVQNETLVAHPFDTSWPRVNLPMRSAWRVRGQPFTFSEWNAGDPNFFAADAVPIAALTAALQDWDAVFFFDYHSRSGGWNTDRLQGYFDLNGQPCKLALVSALANLYRRGDLAPLTVPAVAAPGMQDGLGALAVTHLLSSDPQLSPEQSYPAPATKDLQQSEARLISTPDKSVVWDARQPETAQIVVETPKTVCAWGLVGGRKLTIGPWTLAFGETERNYAVFVATSRDDKPLVDSSSILLTLVANAENRDMGWNADRTGVGTRWGRGPTQVNGVPLELHFVGRPETYRLFALDGRGQRMQPVPIERGTAGDVHCHLGPGQQTLWYELTCGPE